MDVVMIIHRISSDGRMLGSCANQSCSLHRNKTTCCLVQNALNFSWSVEVFSFLLEHGSFLCVLKLVVEVCSHINTSFIFNFVTRLNLCQRLTGISCWIWLFGGRPGHVICAVISLPCLVVFVQGWNNCLIISQKKIDITLIKGHLSTFMHSTLMNGHHKHWNA